MNARDIIKLAAKLYIDDYLTILSKKSPTSKVVR